MARQKSLAWWTTNELSVPKQYSRISLTPIFQLHTTYYGYSAWSECSCWFWDELWVAIVFWLGFTEPSVQFWKRLFSRWFWDKLWVPDLFLFLWFQRNFHVVLEIVFLIYKASSSMDFPQTMDRLSQKKKKVSKLIVTLPPSSFQHDQLLWWHHVYTFNCTDCNANIIVYFNQVEMQVMTKTRSPF